MPAAHEAAPRAATLRDNVVGGRQTQSRRDSNTLYDSAFGRTALATAVAWLRVRDLAARLRSAPTPGVRRLRRPLLTIALRVLRLRFTLGTARL